MRGEEDPDGNGDDGGDGVDIGLEKGCRHMIPKCVKCVLRALPLHVAMSPLCARVRL
jgi:hypothetical protein